MRDLGLALTIAGLILAALAALLLCTRTRPRPRHAINPPGEEDTFIAELRGQTDRFTPGVVLPRTPQLGEPLTPLPVVLPPRQPDADDAYDDAKAIVADPPPEPRHEPLLERYERLIDPRPREVQELLHHHRNSEEAVQSMFTRAQAEQVRALANGQVSGD